jgi:hypothetical protein
MRNREVDGLRLNHVQTLPTNFLSAIEFTQHITNCMNLQLNDAQIQFSCYDNVRQGRTVLWTNQTTRIAKTNSQQHRHPLSNSA